MSNLLEKARSYETEKLIHMDLDKNHYFTFLHRQVGSTIQMVSQYMMEKCICSISIIHTTKYGDQCTGDIV